MAKQVIEGDIVEEESDGPVERDSRIIAGMRDRRDRRHAWLNDILRFGIDETRSFFKTINSSIKAKVSLLQDVSNVSLAVLAGMITLSIFSKDRIKTHLLFYLAGTLLIICIVAAFSIRMLLLRAWEQTAWLLKGREREVWDAIGNMKYHDTRHHEEISDHFRDAMSKEIQYKDDWYTSLSIVNTVTIIFIVSIVMLGLSLLFSITTK